MYAGHFAAGLAIKGKVPSATTWALLLGTGFLDVLFRPFRDSRYREGDEDSARSPGFSLDFIDWSHSLVMALA